MRIQFNYRSGKPLYLQVVDQIKAAAASGALQPGEALPSIRTLAAQLRVNRNTLAKAYTELDHQGIIATVAGKGCFLKKNGSPFKKEVATEILAGEIDAAIVQAHHLQISPADFLAIVRKRLEIFQRAGEDSIPK